MSDERLPAETVILLPAETTVPDERLPAKTVCVISLPAETAVSDERLPAECVILLPAETAVPDERLSAKTACVIWLPAETAVPDERLLAETLCDSASCCDSWQKQNHTGTIVCRQQSWKEAKDTA